MTRQGWAERKVDGYGLLAEETAAAFILAEHRRAVRAVKQEIVATEKLRDTALRADNVAAEAVYLDTIVALNKALAALQKGRT